MGQNSGQEFVLRSRIVLDLDNLNQGVRQAQGTVTDGAHSMSESFRQVTDSVENTNDQMNWLSRNVFEASSSFDSFRSANDIINGVSNNLNQVGENTDGIDHLNRVISQTTEDLANFRSVNDIFEGASNGLDQLADAVEEPNQELKTFVDELANAGTTAEAFRQIMNTGDYDVEKALRLTRAIDSIGVFTGSLEEMPDSAKKIIEKMKELIDSGHGLDEALRLATSMENLGILNDAVEDASNSLNQLEDSAGDSNQELKTFIDQLTNTGTTAEAFRQIMNTGDYDVEEALGLTNAIRSLGVFNNDMEDMPESTKKAINKLKELIDSGHELDEAFRLTNSMRNLGMFGDVVEDSTQQANAGIDLLKKGAKGLAAYFAFDTIKDGFFECVKAAEDFNISMKGLTSTAESFGIDAKQAIDATNELADGLVGIEATSNGLKKLMSTGFSLSEAMDMTKALKDIGAYNNIVGDLEQAYEDFTKGAKTNSIELMENIGFTERLSTIMKRAGVSMENGIDLVNNLAQRRAVYNAILAEGKKYEGDAAELAKELTGAKANLGIEYKKLAATIGNKFKPAVLEATNLMSKGLKSVRKHIENTGKTSDKLEPLVTRMKELKSKTNLTVTEQTDLKNVMNQISVISPSVVSGYDDQGNAIINLQNATKGLIDTKIAEIETEKSKLEVNKISLEKELENLDKNFKKKQERYQKDLDSVIKMNFSKEKQSEDEFNKEIKRVEELLEIKKKAFANSSDSAKPAILEKINEYEEIRNNLIADQAEATKKLNNFRDGYESNFYAENRATIAKIDNLKNELELGELKQRQYDETLSKLNKITDIEGYKTATEEEEARVLKEKLDKDIAKAKLDEYISNLKDKASSESQIVESHNNDLSQIELDYEKQLITTKDDFTKTILKKEKDRDIKLLDAKKTIAQELLALEADKNEKIKIVENEDEAKKIISDYEIEAEAKKTAFLSEIKTITLNSEKEIALLKEIEEQKNFIFENSTKKKIEIEQDYQTELSTLEADYKVNSLKAKTQIQKDILEKELAKNKELLALEKETAEKLIEIEIKKQKKLKEAASTDEKQTITVEYNNIQNNTVKEMQDKTTKINYEYEADIVNSETQQEAEQKLYDNAYAKQQIEADYARDMLAISGQYELDKLNAKDEAQQAELEQTKAHKEALLELERDNSLKILELEKAKNEELNKASTPEEKFAINEIYNQAIAEQEKLLIRETNSLKLNHAKQEKQRKIDYERSMYFEWVKNRGIKQAKASLLSIEEQGVSNLIRGKAIGFTQLREMAKMELKEYLYSEGTKAGIGAIKETAWGFVDIAAMNPAGAAAHFTAAGELAGFATLAGVAGNAIKMNASASSFNNSNYETVEETQKAATEKSDDNTNNTTTTTEEQKERTKVYANARTSELLKALIPELNQMIEDGEVDLVVS